MSYGTGLDWTLSEKEGIEQIKAAYALGINVSGFYHTLLFSHYLRQTFDTANIYSGGQSEIILGKAINEINAPRKSFVIMTKLYFPTLENGEMTLGQLMGGEKADDYGLVNQWGLSRKNIFDSVKASLKRLNLEYIDVLQCHRFDTEVEIPEVMKALDDVVKSGMVRYIGMSSSWAWQFHAMQSKSSLYFLRLVVFPIQTPSRLRTRERADSIHFHAKPLFLALPRRGAGDEPPLRGK